ncbi:hypothetical protein AB1Y20_000258 [Prymnesium parvum]|uniref:Palmitoyltransferase n=1 Tax=Prymnesium parvum TaxID=97485 RepID=A0AB34K4C3_PRYPA
MSAPSACWVLLSLLWDTCCAPVGSALRRDYVHLRTSIQADLRQLRTHGIMRRKPEKGVLRIVLALGWAAVHLFVLVTFAVYGAFATGPVHATWWLLTTLLAGVMYVRLMYSDPGVIDGAALLQMTRGLALGDRVVGSDTGRGLLQDVEGELPAMSSILASHDAAEGAGAADKRQGLLAAADAEEKQLGAARTTARDAAERAIDARAPPSDGAAADGGDGAGAPPPSEARQASEAGLAEVCIEMEPVQEAEAAGGGARGRKQPARARVDPTAGGAAEDADDDDDDERGEALRRALADNPRIAGIHEAGEAEAEAERIKRAEERRAKPEGISDYFSGYCQEADMYLPIRAKYCKKHRAVIGKFDHYCYALGNSVGELNHGQFYRMVFMQEGGRCRASSTPNAFLILNTERLPHPPHRTPPSSSTPNAPLILHTERLPHPQHRTPSSSSTPNAFLISHTERLPHPPHPLASAEG